MSTRKCGCVIATERNTASVRAQAEMGGYVKHECEFHRNQRLAAGASEGQEPVAWMTEGKYPSPRFIIGNTDPSGVWKETYVPLYTHPSAEIAALRERIAGMEKDAQDAKRYRTAKQYGYVSDNEELRIDSYIAKEKQG